MGIRIWGSGGGRTESEEEVEEAADVEGDVGDELTVLPVRLHRDAHVHRAPHPAARARHCC
jgi:hypothetical protein